MQKHVLNVELNSKEAEQNSKNLSRELKQVDNSGNMLGRTFGGLNPKLLATGAALAALTVTVKGSIGEFARLQTAMAEVSTLMDDTSGISNLKAEVKELSIIMGSEAAPQAKALYNVISAGAKDSASAISTLTQANKLAIGGVTDIETATTGLTASLNAYQQEGITASEVSDTLFVGMKGGITTIGALSESLAGVTPLAANLKVPLDQVVASVSAITTNGTKTSVAVTQLKAILAGVVKPSKDAAEAAKEMGIQFNSQALASKGLVGFLEEVKEATNGNQEAMARLFPSIEALVGVSALTGGQFDTLTSIMEKMEKKTGETDKAFNKIKGTFDFEYGVLQSNLSGVAESIGSMVEPLLGGGLELINDFFAILRGAENIRGVTEEEIVGNLQQALTEATTALERQKALAGEMGESYLPYKNALDNVKRLQDEIIERKTKLREPLVIDIQTSDLATADDRLIALSNSLGQVNEVSQEATNNNQAFLSGLNEQISLLEIRLTQGEREYEIARVLADAKRQEVTLDQELIATRAAKLVALQNSLSAQQEEASLKQRIVEQSSQYIDSLQQEVDLLRIEAEQGEQARAVAEAMLEIDTRQLTVSKEKVKLLLAEKKAIQDQIKTEQDRKKVKEETQKANEKLLKSMDEEIELLRIYATQGREAYETQLLINQAKEQGATISEDVIRQKAKEVEAYERSIDAQEVFKENIREVSDVLVDSLDGTQDFADGMVSIIENMLKEMAALAIAETIAGFFGYGSGAGGSADYSGIFGQVIGSYGGGTNGGTGGTGGNYGNAAASGLSAYSYYEAGNNSDSTSGQVINYGMAGASAYQTGAQLGAWGGGTTATPVATSTVNGSVTTTSVGTGTSSGAGSVGYGGTATGAGSASGASTSLSANSLGSSGAYTGGGAAGPAGAGNSAAASGNAAGSSSAASGAMTAAAIVAVMYAMYEMTEANDAKRQQTALHEFHNGQFDTTQIQSGRQSVGFRTRTDSGLAGRQGFVTGGYNSAYLADAAGADRQMSSMGVTDEDGNYWFQIRDGMEAAQEVFENFSPEVEAFQQRQFENHQQELSNAGQRREAEGQLIEIRKQQALEAVNSQTLVRDAFEQTRDTIIAAHGDVETDAAAVGDAIADGFISAAEAAKAGLDSGAQGMVAALEAVRANADLARVAVASIGDVGVGGLRGGTGDAGGRSGTVGVGVAQNNFTSATGQRASGAGKKYGGWVTKGTYPLAEDNRRELVVPNNVAEWLVRHGIQSSEPAQPRTMAVSSNDSTVTMLLERVVDAINRSDQNNIDVGRQLKDSVEDGSKFAVPLA